MHHYLDLTSHMLSRKGTSKNVLNDTVYKRKLYLTGLMAWEINEGECDTSVSHKMFARLQNMFVFRAL